MPWFNTTRRGNRQPAEPEREGKPRPFPTLSTFLGMATVLFVLWLLATGLSHLFPTSFPTSERPAPSNTIDTGATK
jgi:hypothetical protein